VVIFIAFNILLEFYEFIHACISFQALAYITDVFNIIDIIHFVFLILTVAYWGYFWQIAKEFNIRPKFEILYDVTTDARPFLTNADQEYEFLTFIDKLIGISDALASYTVYAGICVLLFVCRILKSLDFQERMGLVTKTIEV
jgi:hypothetical protein